MRAPHQKVLEIMGLIKEGFTVLTVNKRLSRYLSRQFEVSMKAAGVNGWDTPRVLPISSYMEDLYPGIGEGVLLSRSRTRALWTVWPPQASQ
mgnify:FL=1